MRPATSTWFVRQVGTDSEIVHVGVIDQEKLELALGAIKERIAVRAAKAAAAVPPLRAPFVGETHALGDAGARLCGLRAVDLDADDLFTIAASAIDASALRYGLDAATLIGVIARR